MGNPLLAKPFPVAAIGVMANGDRRPGPINADRRPGGAGLGRGRHHLDGYFGLEERGPVL